MGSSSNREIFNNTRLGVWNWKEEPKSEIHETKVKEETTQKEAKKKDCCLLFSYDLEPMKRRKKCSHVQLLSFTSNRQKIIVITSAYIFGSSILMIHACITFETFYYRYDYDDVSLGLRNVFMSILIAFHSFFSAGYGHFEIVRYFPLKFPSKFLRFVEFIWF